ALSRPAAEIAAPWAKLPHTLVHGDSKVANFAVLPGNRLCALDWAFVGRAPCTVEIGWYVAVNAPRLTGSKGDTFRRYRTLLEGHLGRALDDGLWERLEEAGVVCGARMLLWSKATAVAAGREGAEAEWAWWEARLERWAARSRAG
ncbi:MAG: phosphotransferase, partial [Gemmatimonadota bacterium]|nr:phosphotransferase [Gemmatimonadota bacterium]